MYVCELDLRVSLAADWGGLKTFSAYLSCEPSLSLSLANQSFHWIKWSIGKKKERKNQAKAIEKKSWVAKVI